MSLGKRIGGGFTVLYSLVSHEAERGRGPLLPPVERQWGNTFPTFSSSSLFDFIFPFPRTIRNYFLFIRIKKRHGTINVTIKVVSVYPLNNNSSLSPDENDQFETNSAIISLHRNSRNRLLFKMATNNNNNNNLREKIISSFRFYSEKNNLSNKNKHPLYTILRINKQFLSFHCVNNVIEISDSKTISQFKIQG